MGTKLAWILGAALLAAGCGSAPESRNEAEAPKPAPKAGLPFDETLKFPSRDRVDVKVYAAPLLGKSFLPGGNVAHYKRGKKEWDLFLVKASDAGAAALLLLDYKKQMTDTRVIAHFGGFAGSDGGTPAFVFAKGRWLAGVRGLPEKEADAAAREFAARIN